MGRELDLSCLITQAFVGIGEPTLFGVALSGAAGSERTAYRTAFARDHLPGVLFDANGADTVVITIPGIHGNFSSNPF